MMELYCELIHQASLNSSLSPFSDNLSRREKEREREEETEGGEF